VIEIGCGPLGGFVPLLSADGYDAVGIDPRAPEGRHYQRVEVEQSELTVEVDAVVACTSLHHVVDPAVVLDRIARTLARGGCLIVFEWAWERFDEATARWCFDRLGETEAAGWLQRRREEWAVSHQSWDAFRDEWAQTEGLHDGETLLRLLDERFTRHFLARGPYFFPDLIETTASAEQEAIDAGQIRATRIDYVGG
jgi:SAM-dependent methyltransferase